MRLSWAFGMKIGMLQLCFDGEERATSCSHRELHSPKTRNPKSHEVQPPRFADHSSGNSFQEYGMSVHHEVDAKCQVACTQRF
jgi:hypothetical protein